MIKKILSFLVLLSALFPQNLKLISANQLTNSMQNGEKVVLLEGNVIFEQDSLVLKAQKAIRFIEQDILELGGNVELEDKSKKMAADIIVFDSKNNIIELKNNTLIQFNGYSLVSDQAVFNRETNIIDLKKQPKIFEASNEIQGSQIIVTIVGDLIKNVEVFGKGVILNRDLESKFSNQNILRAEKINISFLDGLLKFISLENMASSEFYINNESSIEGKNLITGDLITVDFLNQEIISMKASGGIMGNYKRFSSDASPNEEIDYFAEKADFNFENNKTKLYGESSIKYGDVNISAASIEMDLKSEIMSAFSFNPFNQEEKITPKFTEKNNAPVYGSEITYNLQSGNGKIVQGETRVQDTLYTGRVITTVNDSTFLMNDCIFTNCNSKSFYIGSKNVKILYNDKVIARPLNVYIGGIPIIGIPVAIFPHSSNERRGGWIMPSIGNSNIRGTYLDGLGYYFAPNDYFGSENLITFADKQGLIFESKNIYSKKYSYNGNINLRTRKFLANQEQDITNINQNNITDYSILWSHNQILRKNQTLNANVNFSSSGSLNRETSLNLNERLDQKTRSSVRYSKNWSKKNISLSVNLDNSQDLLAEEKVTIDSDFFINPPNKNSTILKNSGSLPNVYLRVGRRNISFPFIENSFLSDLQWDYSSQIKTVSKNFYKAEEYISESNQPELRWSTNNKGEIKTYNDSNSMMKNKFSLNAPFTLFRYISVNPNANLNLDFVNRYQGISKTNGIESLDFQSGVKERITGNLSVNLYTKIYGVLPLGVGKIESIRHVISPRVSYTYSPGYLNNDNYFIDIDDEMIDIFQGSLIGYTPRNSSKRASIGLGNIFQAKTLSENSKSEKIDLFSLQMNTSYNFEAPEFKWSLINLNLRSKYKRLNFDLSTTHDFYKFDPSTSSRSNKIGSPRLTSLKFSSSVNLSGKIKNSLLLNESKYSFIDEISNAGWNSNVGISFIQNKMNPNNESKTFWINANNSFQASKNWKIKHSIRYDFINKKTVRQNLSMYREIDCWEFYADWVPSGYAKGFYLRLNLRSDMFKDLKIEKRSGIYNNRPNF